MRDKYNLSGYWAGAYKYAFGEKEVPFSATLSEDNGILAGTTQEQGGQLSGSSQELIAEIKGNRAAETVTFEKIYSTETGIFQHPVEYSGHLSKDGNTLTGNWAFSAGSFGRGTFRMERQPSKVRTGRNET